MVKEKDGSLELLYMIKQSRGVSMAANVIYIGEKKRKKKKKRKNRKKRKKLSRKQVFKQASESYATGMFYGA